MQRLDAEHRSAVYSARLPPREIRASRKVEVPEVATRGGLRARRVRHVVQPEPIHVPAVSVQLNGLLLPSLHFRHLVEEEVAVRGPVDNPPGVSAT